MLPVWAEIQKQQKVKSLFTHRLASKQNESEPSWGQMVIAGCLS